MRMDILTSESSVEMNEELYDKVLHDCIMTNGINLMYTPYKKHRFSFEIRCFF